LLQERRAALDAVLASSTFARNQRLSRLLTYLCSKSFAGEAASLKEYTIATDVFGRPPDFDQSSDAIVRVEIHRLRKKLKEFYAREGADQNVEIVIHTGHYAPEFLERQTQALWKEVVPLVPVTLPPVKTRTLPLAGRRSSNSPWIWMATAALVMILITAVWAITRNRTAAAGTPSLQANAAPAIDSSGPIRILSGRTRSQRDREGNEWGPDAFFTGGSTLELPSQPIYRTRNPFLYLAGRKGEFSYRIPLKSGVYELHLHFADSFIPGVSTEGGENMRIFNVDANGRPLLRDFDIIASAGPNTACERVFKDIGPGNDGYLELKFTKEVNAPLLSAIEIMPAVLHRIRPMRITTQDEGFTDKSGVAWAPDNYFLNGRAIAKVGMVSGPIDPQVYERERYGNFSYALPAAPGTYALTLHFAETYFGPKEQGGGGVGDRIFDVFCNGTALLNNLDVFKEAGAGDEVIKTFHGLQPNAQGTMLISFIPRKNYAMVSALELVDETAQ
jgi:hypothetical protein